MSMYHAYISYYMYNMYMYLVHNVHVNLVHIISHIMHNVGMLAQCSHVYLVRIPRRDCQEPYKISTRFYNNIFILLLHFCVVSVTFSRPVA